MKRLVGDMLPTGIFEKINLLDEEAKKYKYSQLLRVKSVKLNPKTS